MADNMEQALDVLKVASGIIGKTITIKIDSGVYSHCRYCYSDKKYDKMLNPKKDIFKLRGTPEKPITFDDIIYVFKKIQKQFDVLEREEIGRTYYYEGMGFDPKTNVVSLGWGS